MRLNKWDRNRFNTHFVKWYDTVQVQANTEVFSSFAGIYINPGITVNYVIKIGLGSVRLWKKALIGLVSKLVWFNETLLQNTLNLGSWTSYKILPQLSY